MSTLVLDEQTRTKLSAMGNEVALYGEDGQKVGFFLTPKGNEQLCYGLLRMSVSQEELETARADYRARGGLTTAQLLDHLRRLDAAGEKSA